MFRKRVADEEIRALLKAAHLEYLIDREGGLDAVNDWNDVLSGKFEWWKTIILIYLLKEEKNKE